ncbi:hypothetical protein PG996_006578 [Apiospora saccharicola]|uniref:Uncharacterized protein n=1 Tax=Apiospora saccharicola TaxID=335842 RepID=A0ABR1V8D7_9PEZI
MRPPPRLSVASLAPLGIPGAHARPLAPGVAGDLVLVPDGTPAGVGAVLGGALGVLFSSLVRAVVEQALAGRRSLSTKRGGEEQREGGDDTDHFDGGVV